MREMTAPELRAYLDSAAVKPLLLDVREDPEYAHCHIDGSVHIPMGDIHARVSELEDAAEIVTICHHGVRSRIVANFLEHNHGLNVINLTGGIDAWAVLVEPGMPRY